ncbi:hypothetical protein [Kribbella catacumbae]|uniref:hypothetical protein n=1 Tax=Kribbella catacumbae TaxID=460086 RepID=UPI000369B8AC|nr:hypothetical protein [Kribbella catacumbae]
MGIEWVVTIGAVCAALIPVTLVARGIYRAWKRVDAFLEDWNGEPARPGRAEVPAMPKRMQLVEDRLTKLEEAVHRG